MSLEQAQILYRSSGFAEIVQGGRRLRDWFSSICAEPDRDLEDLNPSLPSTTKSKEKTVWLPLLQVPFSRVVYIEDTDVRLKDAKDYYGLAPGKTVMLRYAKNPHSFDVTHPDCDM
jgi:hypothetical protein